MKATDQLLETAQAVAAHAARLEAYVLTLWAEQIAGEIRRESVEVMTWPGRKPAPHVVPTEAELEQARMRLEEA